MPSGLFNEYKHKLLGHIFGNRTFSVPSTIYIGLSKTACLADGTGITEVTGGSYARVAIANNSINWTTPVNKQVKNVNTITFNTATADWNTYVASGGVLYVFYAETSTGTTGNLMGFCDIPYKFIQSGTTLIIKPNGLTLSQV